MMKNHPLHQILHPVHPPRAFLSTEKTGIIWGLGGVNPLHGMWRSLVAKESAGLKFVMIPALSLYTLQTKIEG